MQCPKCAYVRTHHDRHVMPGTCPACGIAYNKWRSAEPDLPHSAASIAVPRRAAEAGLRSWLWATLTYVKPQSDPGLVWGRLLVLVLFVIWGLRFMYHGVDWEHIGGSFMHAINLPFHEFGHVLFSPFGHFMMILGGSLFQIVVPLIFLVAFSVQKHDNFAAAIMLWWAGQNFIDVAPYIADAKHRVLPLIGGLSEDYHDWGNLLTMLGQVEHAGAYARLSFFIGSVLMLLSYYWAGWVLLQQKKSLLEQGVP